MLASFSGARRKRLIHTVCACMAPQVFPEELGNYCIRLCVARSCITGSLESSHIKVVSSGKEVAFMSQAVLHALSKVRKPGMVLKDEQTLTYAGSPLSFVTATRNIRPR